MAPHQQEPHQLVVYLYTCDVQPTTRVESLHQMQLYSGELELYPDTAVGSEVEHADQQARLFLPLSCSLLR